MQNFQVNLNPHNLKIGEEYFIQYIHCDSEWCKVKITRFTDMGYPWYESKNSAGIISDSYHVKKINSIEEYEEGADNFILETIGEDRRDLMIKENMDLYLKLKWVFIQGIKWKEKKDNGINC